MLLSNNLKTILILLNTEKFQSGVILGKALDVSRSAIWKMIVNLKKLGIEIDSIKSKGYRIRRPIILLDHDKILKKIKSYDSHDMSLNIIDTSTSTNDHIKKISGNPAIVISEHQSASKGRQGKSWVSTFGENILLSLKYKTKQPIYDLGGLSLIIGLSVIHSLEIHYGIKTFKLKWPNDILWENNKLAGILVEVYSRDDGQTDVIIGLGLNINSSPDIKNTTSITDILQISNIDRNNILSLIIKDLLNYLNVFEENNFTKFIEEYSRVDYLKNLSIKVQTAQEIISGTAKGVSKNGLLIIQHKDKRILQLSSGETSIVKESSVRYI